jgi:hypothetical protein
VPLDQQQHAENDAYDTNTFTHDSIILDCGGKAKLRHHFTIARKPWVIQKYFVRAKAAWRCASSRSPYLFPPLRAARQTLQDRDARGSTNPFSTLLDHFGLRWQGEAATPLYNRT